MMSKQSSCIGDCFKIRKIMNAYASHPYTLASCRSQNSSQNLPKSMAVPIHGDTAKNKARAHNNVYNS